MQGVYVMKKQKPPEIYLTDELGETTWCEDKVTDTDTKYHHDDKYKALEVKLQKARECLEFYAGNEPWRVRSKDFGERARKTLEELK